VLPHHKFLQRGTEAGACHKDGLLPVGVEQLHKAVYFFFWDTPDKGGDVGGVVFVVDLVLDQKTDAVDHIGVAGIAHLFAQPDHGRGGGIILRCKLSHAALTAVFCGFQHRLQKLLLVGIQMILIRQLVKVVVEIGDEKEIQEFPVGELKFRSRKKKVKVSEQELKELKDLEDKKGDSKLDD